MMPVFFASELEGVATYWRIFRKDGIALGFTSHDKSLVFGGLRHRAAPGMVPSSIRLTSDISPDSTEVQGALSHDTISDAELAAGLFDAARVEIGAVDWETLEHASLYCGTLGDVRQDRRGFTCELKSAKSALENCLVPRTSPTCRARFCGPGCNLSAARFTRVCEIGAVDLDANTIALEGIEPGEFVGGELRLLAGPQTGVTFAILGYQSTGLVLDRPLASGTIAGTSAFLTQGCDRTFATCKNRFGNGINFRGEPFLPGNDLLARYPSPK